MGIRQALGAAPRRPVVLAMRTALQHAVIGVAIGTSARSRHPSHQIIALRYHLIGSLTWAGARAVVMAACVIGGYVPARRADAGRSDDHPQRTGAGRTLRDEEYTWDESDDTPCGNSLRLRSGWDPHRQR